MWATHRRNRTRFANSCNCTFRIETREPGARRRLTAPHGVRTRRRNSRRHHREALAEVDRVWKTMFANDPLRSDLDRARDPPSG